MYTEEDINNLAEFIYLAYQQTHWTYGKGFVVNWKDITKENRCAWLSAAKVALEFKTKDCKEEVDKAIKDNNWWHQFPAGMK